MLSWLTANGATVAVGAVVLLVVVLIIIKLYKDKEQGKHSCGGSCECCKLCSSCKPTAKEDKTD